MISALDDALGALIESLTSAGMINDTIIVFSSDNGGQPTAGGASNVPLRGAKNTWFEGGLRVPSFIYSPLFDSSMTGVVNSW